jgi:hypothetical protein
VTTKVHLGDTSIDSHAEAPGLARGMTVASGHAPSTARIGKDIGVEAAETRKSVAQEGWGRARDRTVGVAQYVIGSR